MCIVADGDGSPAMKFYGNHSGSGTGQLNLPSHLAVDRQGYVLVADQNNDRIVLLSASLTFVRVLISPFCGLRRPWRLHLDETRGLLYVAEHKKS